MADPKDTRGFFRKVVNFVVNPATEWGEGGRPSEARESEFAKSELKAMIERKRRNDFVRKRELDMLRKLRRQGLTPEQLAALGSSSGMADTESKAGDTELPPTTGMKAKIDEIEQQMAGNAIPGVSRRPLPADTRAASGQAAPARPSAPPIGARPSATAPPLPDAGAEARALADTVVEGARLDESDDPGLAFAPTLPPPVGVGRNGRMAHDAPPAAAHQKATPRRGPVADSQSPSAMEVSEAAHDPDLDEAVISYANGDNDHAERLLLNLIRDGGARNDHGETWMVVFDLYRATGQQARFEPLALEYAHRFGRSAPHWFSVPKLIAEAASQAQAVRPKPSRIDGQVGWICSERLDGATVTLLRSRSLSMPLPWVFDWTPLKQIDPDATEPLLALFKHWTPQNLDMRWIAGEQLLSVVADAAPIGVPDVDPALWQLRLQILRMCNRPDKFDEVAIDYCVTYEISPPSWEPAVCRVRLGGLAGAAASNVAPATIVGDASTSFVESQLFDEPGLVQMATLELSGQLAGDIADVLRKLDQQLGAATLMEVSCTRLLRVDFMASGDLLNWVLARNREERVVAFVDTNRLVALFFSAVGIDAHATVKVRAV